VRKSAPLQSWLRLPDFLILRAYLREHSIQKKSRVIRIEQLRVFGFHWSPPLSS
jgi:hypothetical protein